MQDVENEDSIKEEPGGEEEEEEDKEIDMKESTSDDVDTDANHWEKSELGGTGDYSYVSRSTQRTRPSRSFSCPSSCVPKKKAICVSGPLEMVSRS